MQGLRDAAMKHLSALVLLAALWSAPAAAAPKTKDNVYALCTVRDVAVKDNQMVGTIYRSAVFSASAAYDSDISLTPEKGGKVSQQFEQHVWKSKGFSKDRMSISDGDEHYCVEAPLTLEGKAMLEAMTRDWDKAKFPRVDMVATGWTPPRREWDRKFDEELADYERKMKAVRDAEERYRSGLAAVEEAKARNASTTKAALDQFERERAAHAAVVAESERQRQAYREEYKRVTGRYPDE
jgi:hypothetical protein